MIPQYRNLISGRTCETTESGILSCYSQNNILMFLYVLICKPPPYKYRHNFIFYIFIVEEKQKETRTLAEPYPNLHM